MIKLIAFFLSTREIHNHIAFSLPLGMGPRLSNKPQY